MCFVWISKQTTFISLYNINWLVFITETECVYCAVRTGSLKIIPVDFRLENVNVIYQYEVHFVFYETTARGIAPIFSQVNPVRSLPKYFFKIHFNIIFTLTATSLKFILPFGIPTKTFHEFLISINATYLFAPSPSTFGVQMMDVFFIRFF